MSRRLSGPRLLLSFTLWPACNARFANACAKAPAPMVPISIGCPSYIGLFSKTIRLFPDETRAEWLFESRQVHTHARPRKALGDVLRDAERVRNLAAFHPGSDETNSEWRRSSARHYVGRANKCSCPCCYPMSRS